MVPSQRPAERSKRLRTILMLLLAADAAFLIIHLIHLTTPYLPALPYSIETDGGFAEWFQYVKELWIILLALILWRRTGRAWILGWVLTFAYILIDDAFSFHELAGDIAYRNLGFGPAFGLRAQDFGELLVTGITGVSLAAIMYLLYRRANENDRAICRDIAMLVVTLVFFGVGLDMVHSTLPSVNSRLAMGVIEDGGEMLTMSVTCWYFLTVVDRQGIAPVPTLVERVWGMRSRT